MAGGAAQCCGVPMPVPGPWRQVSVPGPPRRLSLPGPPEQAIVPCTAKQCVRGAGAAERIVAAETEHALSGPRCR